MNLNLDPGFQPYLDGTEISFNAFTFPGGEPHIKITSPIPPGTAVAITHRVRTFQDMGLILMATDALRRMGVSEISLFLPYFPAARQDRVMVPGEPLSVKVYADLLNSLNLREVIVFDPHSEVTPAVLHQCRVITNHAFIREVVGLTGGDLCLVSPDGGALKKIYQLSTSLDGMEVVECGKSRDVKTGKLKGFKVYADDLGGKDCLIVDDICDGGATFIGLAEALKQKNAGKLYLAVSHGIFSKGTEALLPHFEQIFATDSIHNSFQHVQILKINDK